MLPTLIGPTVAEIGRAITDVMDLRAELISLPDAPCYPHRGIREYLDAKEPFISSVLRSLGEL
jgi:hypothetical protein